MSHMHIFGALFLDGAALHTPAGVMPLDEISRAEFCREVTGVESSPPSQETSAPAVVGGAAVGGVLFGGVGAVVGGVLGSAVKEEEPHSPRVHTKSVRLVFETPTLRYSQDVERDQEMAAFNFAEHVRKAAERAR